MKRAMRRAVVRALGVCIIAALQGCAAPAAALLLAVGVGAMCVGLAGSSPQLPQLYMASYGNWRDVKQGQTRFEAGDTPVVVLNCREGTEMAHKVVTVRVISIQAVTEKYRFQRVIDPGIRYPFILEHCSNGDYTVEVSWEGLVRLTMNFSVG